MTQNLSIAGMDFAVVNYWEGIALSPMSNWHVFSCADRRYLVEIRWPDQTGRCTWHQPGEGG